MLEKYKGEESSDDPQGQYLLDANAVKGYNKSSHKFTNDMWTDIKKDVKELIQNMYMLQAANVATAQYDRMVA